MIMRNLAYKARQHGKILLGDHGNGISGKCLHEERGDEHDDCIKRGYLERHNRISPM